MIRSPVFMRYLLSLSGLLVIPHVAFAFRPCAEGPPKPNVIIDPRLRPRQTAYCSYDVDELMRRVTRLSIGSLPYSVETAERTLGLPNLTTVFDDPRDASYWIELVGKGGWTALVSVQETFFPLNQGPARFVPGLHPKRLYKVDDADLRIEMSLQPSSREKVCEPIANAILRAGWFELPGGPGTDGVLVTSPIYRSSGKQISIFTDFGTCGSVTLEQSKQIGGPFLTLPKLPKPKITFP